MTAMELAGFVAAHAVWGVAEGGGVAPMLAFLLQDESRRLERLAFANTPEAVEYGRRRLGDDPFSAGDGVFAYDGRIDADGEQLDAVILEIIAYWLPDSGATVAVPYSPADPAVVGGAGRFRVHRPHLLEWHGCEDFGKEAMLRAFYEGVDSHEEGAKVWDAALDPDR